MQNTAGLTPIVGKSRVSFDVLDFMTTNILQMKPFFLLTLFFTTALINLANAADYYVHPTLGNDLNDGSSKAKAIQTLAKASTLSLRPGDRILLAAGVIYPGSLQLRKVSGEKQHPIVVESTPWDAKDKTGLAIIDAKGSANGILIEDCSHVKISSLGITGNGYTVYDSSTQMRCGVMIRTGSAKNMKGITLERLQIYDVFCENPGFQRSKEEVTTANGTQRYGWGIRLMNALEDSSLEEVLIQDCGIKNVSHTGIKITGKGKNIQFVRLLGNAISGTGGPGIQMSNTRFVYVANNEVMRSGSTDDSRKWGRGSGLWTWSASDILIEKNKFMYANGPGDSAGAHIDYNCDNVILQYNLSAHNAGGFCEILGNNYNCAYRYNISVNDGYRIKGKDGAFQEGKTLWLSGYQGNKERKGPVNTYIYNNTIFVNKEIGAKIAIDNSSEGVLIANNIFYFQGESALVKGDQYKPDTSSGGVIKRVVFQNNLFLHKNTWPTEAIISDTAPMFGDPGFRNAGGLSLEDYIPANRALIRKGIEIPFLPEDAFGLMHGLQMQTDILGQRRSAVPGIGAINPPE